MMLAPFEPIGIECDDYNEADIFDGEKDFYDFMKNLYNDMYVNPAKYAVQQAIEFYPNYFYEIGLAAD